MKKSFEQQIKEIKWEFGNPNHIKVLEMLERINKKKKLLVDKRRNNKIIKALLEEITTDEKHILFTIGLK